MTVNCQTPGMLAGGDRITLSGQLQIVVSPTTGMTKLAEGSQLTVSKTEARSGKRVQGTIQVSGTFYALSGSKSKIVANQEPSSDEVDDRTFSSITIDGANSSIFEINGSLNHPLECAAL
ncbi:MAG: hypothetical protein EOP09_19285 [Proteobacteria bacterium]|nr:MAG: hypothetical protein EOP09_19285 [Pseudomonadota bacterium]